MPTSPSLLSHQHQLTQAKGRRRGEEKAGLRRQRLHLRSREDRPSGQPLPPPSPRPPARQSLAPEARPMPPTAAAAGTAPLRARFPEVGRADVEADEELLPEVGNPWGKPALRTDRGGRSARPQEDKLQLHDLRATVLSQVRKAAAGKRPVLGGAGLASATSSCTVERAGEARSEGSVRPDDFVLDESDLLELLRVQPAPTGKAAGGLSEADVSLTPAQLLTELETRLLEIVLVDARRHPLSVFAGAISLEAIGAVLRKPPSAPQNQASCICEDGGGPFSSFPTEESMCSGPLQMFGERLAASHVIVYDDEGLVDSAADVAARVLRASGRCLSARRLSGGLCAWWKLYGRALLDPAPWAVRQGLVADYEPSPAIQALRARQSKLVSAVWHSKTVSWSTYIGKDVREGEKGMSDAAENNVSCLDIQGRSTRDNSALDGEDSANMISDLQGNLLGGAVLASSSPPGNVAQSAPVPASVKVSPQDYPHEIIPNLFLGGETTALQDRIHAFGINRVIRMGWFLTKLDGVQYNEYLLLDRIGDAESICKVIPDAVDAIARGLAAGERVLVHCQAGVSRSTTVILAFLMRHHRLTFRQAWDWVFRVRPIVRPNKGFAKVLLRLERQLRAEGCFAEPAVLPPFAGFSRNTESDAPLPLYWVCESFDHYREYLETEIRLAHLRRKIEVTREVAPEGTDTTAATPERLSSCCIAGPRLLQASQGELDHATVAAANALCFASAAGAPVADATAASGISRCSSCASSPTRPSSAASFLSRSPTQRSSPGGKEVDDGICAIEKPAAAGGDAGDR